MGFKAKATATGLLVSINPVIAEIRYWCRKPVASDGRRRHDRIVTTLHGCVSPSGVGDKRLLYTRKDRRPSGTMGPFRRLYSSFPATCVVHAGLACSQVITTYFITITDIHV